MMLHTQKVSLPVDLEKDPDQVSFGDNDCEDEYEDEKDSGGSFEERVFSGFHKEKDEGQQQTKQNAIVP
jgi:hypothetical protein